jgi:hypothetical protein
MSKRSFHALPLPQQAGILSNDPRFCHFAAKRLGLPIASVTPSTAAEYLRTCCNIESRRELAANSEAQEQFRRLQTEFDAWIGRITAQNGPKT